MKLKKLLLTSVLLLTVMWTWAVPPHALAKGLTYEGSSTIGETVIPDAVKAFAKQTGITFDKVGVTGSSQGFKAVMAGQTDLGACHAA